MKWIRDAENVETIRDEWKSYYLDVSVEHWEAPCPELFDENLFQI